MYSGYYDSFSADFTFSAAAGPDTVSGQISAFDSTGNEVLENAAASGTVDCGGDLDMTIAGGLTFTGTLSADGTSVSGTYTDTSGTTVVDSGTWSGELAAPEPSTMSPDAGTVAGGDVVEIDGYNMFGVTGVDFGSDPGTNLAVNDQSVFATTPASAQTGPVTVFLITPLGTFDVGTFTYYATPTVSAVSPNHGGADGGTTVTVTGTGFFSGSTVFFENLAHTVTFGEVTPSSINGAGTSLTVTTPPGTGVADVVVDNAELFSATSTADHFSFQDPSVTSVLPTTGALMGGLTVTIHGSNFTGATGVSFGGVPGSGVHVVNSGAITAVTPEGTAGTVDVTVTTPLGTSATRTADHFTYVAPTITKVSPNSGSVAGGTAVVITGMQLEGTYQVLFGSTPTPSPPVNVSPTEVTVVSPPGTLSTVDILAFTAGDGRTLPVTADHYTYKGPAVVKVSPTSGSAEGGVPVTITGTNFAQVQAVLFGGIPAPSFTVVSSTRITAVTPQQTIGRASVTVVATSASSPVTGASAYTASAVNCPTPVGGPWSGTFNYQGGSSGTFTAGLSFKKVTTGVWSMTGTISAAGASGTLAGTNSKISCNSWILNISLDGGSVTGVLAGTLAQNGATAQIWTTSGRPGANQIGGSQLASWSGAAGP